LFCTLSVAAYIVLFVKLAHNNVLLFLDEYHSILNLHQPWHVLAKTFDRNGSGLAWPLLQKMSVEAFGRELWVYRFPALVGAIGSLVIFLPTARPLVGKIPALVAFIAFATCTFQIYYSHVGRAYSLVIFFSLAVVFTLTRLSHEKSPKFRYHLMFAACAALAAFVHLITVPFVAGVGIAATLASQKCRDRLWRLAASMFAAGLAAALLYLPAWSSTTRFFDRVIGKSSPAISFNLLDMVDLLAGTREAAVVWVVAFPIALVWLFFFKRRGSLVLLAACIAPVLAVVIGRPKGSQFAYARYLLPALPFVFMALASLIEKMVRLVRTPSRWTGTVCILGGGALAIAAFLVGPLGVDRSTAGPFANADLALHPTRAFDTPWEEAPVFYSTLAKMPQKVRIVELPAFRSRQQFLYRNYFLHHGKEVWFAPFHPVPPLWPTKGYLTDLETAQLESSGAHYLIIHLDAKRELMAYWASVTGGLKGEELKKPPFKFPKGKMYQPSSEIVTHLTARLGGPIFRDKWIAVWELRPQNRKY
jgi:hypothetical protein